MTSMVLRQRHLYPVSSLVCSPQRKLSTTILFRDETHHYRLQYHLHDQAKMYLTLPILLVALAASARADDESACAAKQPALVRAIGQFCQKPDIMVPSTYSNKPVTAQETDLQPGSAWVKITGSCNPPEWVPQVFCFSQFYSMCAQGDNVGTNTRYYGGNNCQKWQTGGSQGIYSTIGKMVTKEI